MTAAFKITLADFAGHWNLHRKIDDARAQASGRFQGVADFMPDPDGLIYCETGVLSLTGQVPLQATRSYLWQQGAGRITVLFADGRGFHHFATDRANSGATHDCPPDIYHVQYDFRRWPDWSAEWQVKGPRKDYAMVSHYQR